MKNKKNIGFKTGMKSLRKDSEKQIKEHGKRTDELQKKDQYQEVLKKPTVEIKVELDFGQTAFNQQLGIQVIA